MSVPKVLGRVNLYPFPKQPPKGMSSKKVSVPDRKHSFKTWYGAHPILPNAPPLQTICRIGATSAEKGQRKENSPPTTLGRNPCV